MHQFAAQILITMLNSYANVVIHILDFHSSIFNIIADLSFLASVTEKVNISRSNTNPEEEVSAAHHHTSLMSLKSLSVLITLHSESNVLQEWHMISKLGYKKHDSFICWKKKETDARLCSSVSAIHSNFISLRWPKEVERVRDLFMVTLGRKSVIYFLPVVTLFLRLYWILLID